MRELPAPAAVIGVPRGGVVTLDEILRRISGAPRDTVKVVKLGQEVVVRSALSTCERSRPYDASLLFRL